MFGNGLKLMFTYSCGTVECEIQKLKGWLWWVFLRTLPQAAEHKTTSFVVLGCGWVKRVTVMSPFAASGTGWWQGEGWWPGLLGNCSSCTITFLLSLCSWLLNNETWTYESTLSSNQWMNRSLNPFNPCNPVNPLNPFNTSISQPMNHCFHVFNNDHQTNSVIPIYPSHFLTIFIPISTSFQTSSNLHTLRAFTPGWLQEFKQGAGWTCWLIGSLVTRWTPTIVIHGGIIPMNGRKLMGNLGFFKPLWMEWWPYM